MDVDEVSTEQRALVVPQREAPGRPQVITPPAARFQVSDRVIVRHSDAIGQLFAALSKAQATFKAVERTQEATITGKANFTYGYETLADVIGASQQGLADNGLVVMQFPFPSQRELTLRTYVGHSSGEWIYNDLTAALDGSSPQAVASGITYLCRYARKAILGVPVKGDDDDGQTAAQTQQTARPQPAQRVSEQRAGEPPSDLPPLVTDEARKGYIVAVEERQGGWYVIRLDTKFFAATKSGDLVSHAQRLAGSEQRVELVSRQGGDPKRTAPTLVEIGLIRG